MKVNEYFWKTTSLTLLLIISFFAGFGAHLEFSSYNPFLSILPAMFKRGKNNDKEI